MKHMPEKSLQQQCRSRLVRRHMMTAVRQLYPTADESVIGAGVETGGIVRARLRCATSRVRVAGAVVACQLHRHEVRRLRWAHV